MFKWLFWKPPSVPEHFYVQDILYTLDGGTTDVVGIDSTNTQRLIRLTQRMFPRWGGVGWLYLDWYKVPRRSPIEQAIVKLLRAVLLDLKSESKRHPSNEKPLIKHLETPGSVILGSPDLVEMSHLTGIPYLVFHIEQMLEYIESDSYGKVI